VRENLEELDRIVVIVSKASVIKRAISMALWRNILGLWPLLVVVVVCGLTLNFTRQNAFPTNGEVVTDGPAVAFHVVR
jgi:hypothetical protein